MSVPDTNRTKLAVRVADEATIRNTLACFERTYGQSSEEFLRRWHDGTMGDRQDFFRWYGACHLAVKLGILPEPQTEWHAVG